MPAVQSLKKQLRGIRSAEKLTRATKTSSTVKFSKLSELYGRYAPYGQACEKMLARFGSGFARAVAPANPAAPPVAVVMAGNKGLCGAFNADLLRFAREAVAEIGPALVVPCGKMAAKGFREPEKTTFFGDLPTFEETAALLEEIMSWRAQGRASRVFVIYPKYKNMMVQTPAMVELFTPEGTGEESGALLVPDEKTLVAKSALPVYRALFYSLALETALGAQAATMMAMRSACDTAAELGAQLEGQINRLRQSSVTADILETAVSEE